MKDEPEQQPTTAPGWFTAGMVMGSMMTASVLTVLLLGYLTMRGAL